REKGMTPYEVMLSESQERMLIIVQAGHEDDVGRLFERWEVPWSVIGHVTDDNLVHIFDDETEVGTMAVDVLVDAPEYEREGVPAAELYEMERLDLRDLAPLRDAKGALLRLL